MKPDKTQSLPAHIAVIMDGNNRWARSAGLTGTAGHRAGAEAARDLVDSCIARDINYLTLFAFSSENWLRPKKEVQGLMALFLAVLKRKEVEQFHAKNVRVRFIGRRESFSNKLLTHMRQVEELTANNSGVTVTVAADYGGRWDIAEAARRLAADVEAGLMTADQVNEDTLQKAICLGDAPAPDLCIRTGGERRISNFLLWQFAYTELYFTDCYWPDFDDRQFQLALEDFASRQRRFGSHPDSE
ncbi:MAG: polyprenyl diphosphate synthase [Gammaproteobacteria bacterium]|jgi:undecaprenyl diphosphate synthase